MAFNRVRHEIQSESFTIFLWIMELNIKNIPVYKEKITFQSTFQSIFLWNVMECYGIKKNKTISIITYYQMIKNGAGRTR